MPLRNVTLAAILILCLAALSRHGALWGHGASAGDRNSVYGNPEDTCDPLNPSNKHRNPRVADKNRHAMAFPLKTGGAQLYYGTGARMRTPQGEWVRATGWVYLNYGMRLEREGRTYFLAWKTNPDAPADSGKKNATGWVAADDLTDEGARDANRAIPHRLANIERPIARDARGQPRTFIVNGTNEPAQTAASRDYKYRGVANGNLDRVINFFNLHDGRAGLQMLVNLPNVPGGGIAEDCFPNGTVFTAAANAHHGLITESIRVQDKEKAEHTLTFIYGKAGATWGWMVKDWLDEGPKAEP